MSEFHWDASPFVALQKALSSGDSAEDQTEFLKKDLLQLLVVAGPNSQSRKQVESKSVKSKDGKLERKFNQDFVVLALQFASQLKIDEIEAAEILVCASTYKTEQHLAVTLFEAAIIMYYKRYEAILSIMSQLIYIDSQYNLNMLFKGDAMKSFLIDRILASFKRVESELSEIHELIRQTKMLQPELAVSSSFIDSINFRRNYLYRFHQMLGELLFTSTMCYSLAMFNNDKFAKILDHIGTFEPNDMFLLHYLPGLYYYTIAITSDAAHDSKVVEMYKKFESLLSEVTAESDIVKNPIKATIMIFFYCFMSGWLSAPWISETETDNRYDQYFENIQIAFTKLIKIGAFEQLMVCTATISGRSEVMDDQFYNINLLLQKHIPNLIPFRVWDIDHEKTKQLHEAINVPKDGTSLLSTTPESNLSSKVYKPSTLRLRFFPNFRYMFHQAIDSFISETITRFSKIIMRLCDSEEDLYLTNIKNFTEQSTLTIDDLAENADVERFYMVLYYNFIGRKQSLGTSWTVSDASDTQAMNFVDFLEWAITKTTNTLIKASLLLTLSGIAENSTQAASGVYEFLSNNSVNTVENGTDKLLIDNGAFLNSVVPSSISSNEVKISWNSIFDQLKSLNTTLGKNYEKFVNKFQSSYNRLFVPQSVYTKPASILGTTNSKELTSSDKKEDDDIKLEHLVLSEEELIEISSYLQLISSVACDHSKVQLEFHTSKQNNVLDILFELLNRITDVASLKISFTSNGFNPSIGLQSSEKVDLKDESVIIGMILTVLKSLVPTEYSDIKCTEIRHRIWNKLDEWVFKNKLSVVSNRFATPSFRNFFDNIFIEYNDVLAFIGLLEALICPGKGQNDNDDEFYVSNNIDGGIFPLPYPLALGTFYRKSGMWPYFDYLLNDVFVNLTDDNFDTDKKNVLLNLILNIMLNSFKFFDYRLVLFADVAGISVEILSKVVEGGKIDTFLFENPATMVMNFCYSSKVKNVLLDCIAIGNDKISDKSSFNSEVQIVKNSLSVMSRIFKFEPTYKDYVLPSIRKILNSVSADTASIDHSLDDVRAMFLPHEIGTFSEKSFCNTLSSNLPIIGHLGLYAGSKFSEISLSSIFLISILASSKEFSQDQNSSNKLLTIFETIDESRRIRLSFVQQFDSYFSDLDLFEDPSKEALDEKILTNMTVKMKILQFLINDLSRSINRITVTHFLLGFDRDRFTGLSLGGVNNQGSIASENSLLKSLLNILGQCLKLNSKDPLTFSYNGITISSGIMKIIVLLCKSDTTSKLVLTYLMSDFDLYGALLQFEPGIDLKNSRFPSTSFFGNLRSLDVVKNEFLFDSYGMGTLLSFFENRNEVLKFFCFQVYSQFESLDHIPLSKSSEIIEKLIRSNGEGSSKIMSFLDILEFNIKVFPDSSIIEKSVHYFNDITKASNVLSLIHLNRDFRKKHTKFENFVSAYDTSNLDYALILNLKKQTVEGKYLSEKEYNDKQSDTNKLSRPLITNGNTADTLKQSNQAAVLNEKELVKKYFISVKAAADFKEFQLKCLHSWVQLVSIILLSKKFNKYSTKIEFILEIFEKIIPNINSYYNYDIAISKELVSLALILFDVYVESIEKMIEFKQLDKDSTDMTTLYERLLPLLHTCIEGLTESEADSALKSDLYGIANKYFVWALYGTGDNDSLLVADDNRFKFLVSLRSEIMACDKRLMVVACSDIDSGDDSNRVAALTLLEFLYRFCVLSNSSYESQSSKRNSVVSFLVHDKNDFLNGLLTSLTRTDRLLHQSQSTGSLGRGISVESLLYELGAFRSTVSLLTKLAESKEGSSYLIQSKVFKILSNLYLFSIDPDLGLVLDLNEVYMPNVNNSGSEVLVRVSLEHPLKSSKSGYEISLCELMIPLMQLIATLLVSVGPSNKELIEEVRMLLKNIHRFYIGMLKRNVLIEEGSKLGVDKNTEAEIKRLSELLILLSLLTNYRGSF